jgi:hypothetical protein
MEDFIDFKALKAFVRAILSHAGDFEWTLQGFGMLRLSMPCPEGDFRLNIWDSMYRVGDVSLMHSHPWDFKSLIVSGALCNLRFSGCTEGTGESFDFATIKPGPGGGITEGKSGTVELVCVAKEYFAAGDVYQQKAEEIHISLPEDGTVTLNRRDRRADDIAQVFWRTGKAWVSAEPRKADRVAVGDIVEKAMRIF